jgi:two-component system sensor histidine kinase/response regulator
MRTDKPHKILYIEDDPGTARLIQKKLGRKGCEVAVARNARAGLAKIKAGRFDLIVLDYFLPDTNGLELIHEIKALPGAPPVVVLTGYSEARTAVAALKAGAIDYLVKDPDQDYVSEIFESLPSWIQKHQQNAEQAHLIDDLKSYAQTVAHDLKNPLSSIKSLTSILAEEHLSEEEISRYSKAIVSRVEKMRKIVDELLLMATMRREDIEVESLNMTRVVNLALERLDFMIRPRQLKIQMPDRFPPALGYASWVEEIWVNYISNALKYGGERPQICLGFDPPLDGFVRFWVEDDGPGIATEDQKKLFVPFNRLENEKEDGHGLGLSIVQRIAEKLNGEVGLDSEWGKGCRFHFTLPYAGEQKSENGQATIKKLDSLSQAI